MGIVSKQQLKFSPSFAFNNLVDQYVTLELQEKATETQEDMWTHMGNELETSNYPKDKICSKLHLEIEDKLWQLKYKELGIPRNEYRWIHIGN